MANTDRIAAAFQHAREQNRAAFIAYICGGDPDFETSVNVCQTLLESGVDILEIGVPFSDPLADGLTNQLAAQRALEAGMTHDKLLALVRRVREKSDKPLILYTYYNLIFSQGIAASLRDYKEAGVDGILTLDCPPEEATELLAASRAEGIANIFIIAPTTAPARIDRIARDATGFLYYVSREGVTGERTDLVANLGESVASIKRHTSLPVVVGFGISTPEHVAAVGRVADGVVVGSALVNVIATHKNEREKIPAALAEKTKALVAPLLRGN
ncbi:MAG: tryptophan synthase subunit alpha [Puniceicoccales bacterium]|jgi:tryptophan synthase alpha chain|nr:tryptophan synthase subunit alpha [Puniceicoccales bacterium]